MKNFSFKWFLISFLSLSGSTLISLAPFFYFLKMQRPVAAEYSALIFSVILYFAASFLLARTSAGKTVFEPAAAAIAAILLAGFQFKQILDFLFVSAMQSNPDYMTNYFLKNIPEITYFLPFIIFLLVPASYAGAKFGESRVAADLLKRNTG